MDNIIKISEFDDLSNDNNVKFFCNGTEVKYEIDPNNPLKLVNGIDCIAIKKPHSVLKNDDETEINPFVINFKK